MDVRSFDSLKASVDRCVKELGAIDYVMYVGNCTAGVLLP